MPISLLDSGDFQVEHRQRPIRSKVDPLEVLSLGCGEVLGPGAGARVVQAMEKH